LKQIKSAERKQKQKRFSVGAGLPAMRATRFIRDTQSMPSQASQLPHWIEYSLSGQVGYQAAVL
jgi:hypothetical protein